MYLVLEILCSTPNTYTDVEGAKKYIVVIPIFIALFLLGIFAFHGAIVLILLWASACTDACNCLYSQSPTGAIERKCFAKIPINYRAQ